MKSTVSSFLFSSVFALVIATAPARGQLVPLEFEVPQVVGIGGGFVPDYEGSNDYQLGVAPAFRYTFAKQERYIQLLANQLSGNVLDHPNWRVGPLFAYQFGRNHNIEDRQVKRMTQIDGTIEGGLFADYVFKVSKNPRHRLILGADFLHDMGGVNKGMKFGLSGRYWLPVAMPLDIFLGTRLNFASGNFMNTYFGVDNKDSIRSGLKKYSADGGPKDIVLMGGAV